MSFFGFDATLPRDGGHPTKAPGFGTAPDPFASISRDREVEENDDDDAYVCVNLLLLAPILTFLL
jgi:DNA topoisomerase 2-associated protein PAT1